MGTSEAAFASDQDGLRELVLEYDAPSGCGSQTEVVGRVREALGSVTHDLPRVRATISVRAGDSNYLVRFHAHKGEVESERTLLVDGCEAAVEASTLLLLLTLDPVLAEALGVRRVVPEADSVNPAGQAIADSQPAQARPERLPDSTPRAPSMHQSPHSAAPTATSRMSWVLGAWAALGGAVVSQISPATGLGVTLEGGVRLGRVRMGLRASSIQSLSASLEEPAGASVRTKLHRLHLTTALELGSPSIRFGPAFDFGVDYVTARVEGVSVSRPGSTLLISAAAGVWSNVVIGGSWGLAARVGALFPLERPRFHVVGLQNPVHRPGPLGLDGFIGLFYLWGSQS